MRKNKSKKSKVPVLDEKSYAAYLEYLKNEGASPQKAETEGQDNSQGQGQVGEERQPRQF